MQLTNLAQPLNKHERKRKQEYSNRINLWVKYYKFSILGPSDKAIEGPTRLA